MSLWIPCCAEHCEFKRATHKITMRSPYVIEGVYRCAAHALDFVCIVTNVSGGAVLPAFIVQALTCDVCEWAVIDCTCKRPIGCSGCPSLTFDTETEFETHLAGTHDIPLTRENKTRMRT